MDGGADGMAGAGAFGSGQAFCGGPHLADADDIGVLTQHPLQQEVLIDVQAPDFRWAGSAGG